MRPLYLVDTDWIIHYLNGNKGIVEKIESLEKDGLTVSVVSVAELYEGFFLLNKSCKQREGPE